MPYYDSFVLLEFPNFNEFIFMFGQAKSLTKDSNIVGFADPKLEGEYSEAAFELVFKLALSCISLEQQRPSMEQVVVKLDESIEISTKARASTPRATP